MKTRTTFVYCFLLSVVTGFAQITVTSGGAVGIGTSAPDDKLVVRGGHGDTAIRLFSDGGGIDSPNSAMMSIWASEPGLTWNGGGIGNNVDNYGPNGTMKRISMTRGGSYARFLDNAIHLVNIDIQGVVRSAIYSNNGNVGVGATVLTHKLTVGGAVRATSFISDTTSYADFVFDPSYRLAPLSEVETHIAEYGHLPDIPSEAEARENGIDLAVMQVKLLQKIEEITLHQIAQEKAINALRRENAELRAQLKQVEALK